MLRRALLASASMDGMNDNYASAGPQGTRGWLPPVIAIAATISCGLLALGTLASAALTDSAPYPRMEWLTAGLYGQAALGVTAIALLIAGRIMARGQRVIGRLGWAVTALSVAWIVATTLLGRPA